MIRTAPVINATDSYFKTYEIRVEFFDYGTPMGWGYHVRTRVLLNGETLPFGAEQINPRKRPAWLPATITIRDWNRIVKSAILKTAL